MIDMQKRHDFSAEIGRKFKPETILLFGSYAYGVPSSDSDVDVLVVMSFEGKNPEKATEIWLATKPGFPVDVMVRKPEEIDRRLALGDPFVKEIFQKGISLYESDRDGMDFKSRG